MQIARGDLVLHLSAHHGDGCPGATVYVRTTRLADFHREITAKGYQFMRPAIGRTPWRSKLMEVVDPFANRLRFVRATRIIPGGLTGGPGRARIPTTV